MAIPAPASTADAVDMVLTGLRHLAAADPTALAARAQAECLQAFERADAIATAARASFLAAFTAGQGYSADADYSPTSWLIHRTRITKGAARGHLGWARRAVTHPQVVAALAEGTVLSESMARTICGWTDKLPAACRGACACSSPATARIAQPYRLQTSPASQPIRSTWRSRPNIRTRLTGQASPKIHSCLGRPPPRPWRCSGTRSSARPSTWSPVRAASRASCAPGSWAPA